MSRSSAPPPAFMQQLMARVDPHQPPRNAALQSAQSLCGRWVWLRRLQIGLASEALAGMVGIMPDDLLLIEAGLAGPEQISEETCQRLGRLLTQNYLDKTLGIAAVGIALGQIEALSEAMLGQVFEDLEAAGMSAAERDRHLAVDLVEPPAPVLAAEAEPFDRRVFEREPGMFEVLWALVNGARDVHAIWLKLGQDNQAIEMVRVGMLINRLQRSQLASMAGRQPDPEQPDEHITIYRVTSEGRRAFTAEHLHRMVEKARAGAANPGSLPGGTAKGSLSNAPG